MRKTRIIKTSKKQDKNDIDTKKAKEYVKYSDLAFRMVAFIFLSVIGGIKLDQWVRFDFPVFTVIFVFVGVMGALAIIFKEFLNKK